MPAERIVSLIASATEIVAALGCEDQLVGRSHECDYPPSVRRLPVCTEAKLDASVSSREIDNRVKAILTEGVSVYRVFSDVLEQIQPTVIITQTQCDVCAVSLKDVEEAVCNLVTSKPKIVSLEPMALADINRDIRAVAAAIGVVDRGEQLIQQCQLRLSAIAWKAAPIRERPTIACIEWIDPLMAAGNWVPELVEIAGGVNVVGTKGQHSPWLTFAELAQKDPDVIAIMPCGFDLARTREEMPALVQTPGWSELRAVREGRVYLTDGNQYFNRPGPRLVESGEILAEILHPSVFQFGHEGTGWERL